MLITCEDCKSEMSDLAHNCPKCGRPNFNLRPTCKAPKGTCFCLIQRSMAAQKAKEDANPITRWLRR